jgi:hypothetical protein
MRDSQIKEQTLLLLDFKLVSQIKELKQLPLVIQLEELDKGLEL